MTVASSSIETDVLVVGARCAGAPTARLLAQRGHRVVMIDRATFPSDTVSTHCITPGGITQLGRWGLFDRVVATNVPVVDKVTMTVGAIEMQNPMGEGDAATTVSPRRTVLDKLLIDAAIECGAELLEAHSFVDVVRTNGRVAGVVARNAEGDLVEIGARVVVGADGTHSNVAAAVEAPAYDERPANGSGYYAYFSGWPGDAVELAFNDHHFAGVFPTNDGQVCVFAGKGDEEFAAMRADVDAGHAAAAAVASSRLGEWVRQSTRESRFFAFRAIPGFYRVPYGPGWALVGDAGFHKDPVTGHGITDAFRDAELLANALHAGLTDSRDMEEALAEYQKTRDEMSKGTYEATQEIAALGWDDSTLAGAFIRFGAAALAERETMAAWPT